MIAPNFAEVCVTITTGSGYWDDGYLFYTINGVSNDCSDSSDCDYDRNAPVYDECLDGSKGFEISLWNPFNNKWAGRIVITEGGRPTTIYCKNCKNPWFHYRNGNNFVADNDDGGQDDGIGHCGKNTKCSILWGRFGTVEISIVYLMKP